MQCQSCHKNIASVRYAEVVDGEVIEQRICQECVKNKQDHTNAGFEFAKPAPFVRKDRFSGGPMGRSPTQRRNQSCQSCATDLNTVMTTGKVGCSSCYDSFSSSIDTLLGDLHGALTHNGKVPHMDDARARARADLQAKRALLKTSLTAERYEEAATLRDEIHALEQGLSTAAQGKL